MPHLKLPPCITNIFEHGADSILGTNVTVFYETGDLTDHIYEDYYEGQGQRDMPLSHNYSDTGYFRVYANVSNLIR